MELKEFVVEIDQKDNKEGKRYVRDFVPSIGSKLVSLVDEIGGISGQPMEVIGYSALGCGMDAFVVLRNESNGEYCMCSIVDWHKKVEIVRGEVVPINSVKFDT